MRACACRTAGSDDSGSVVSFVVSSGLPHWTIEIKQYIREIHSKLHTFWHLLCFVKYNHLNFEERAALEQGINDMIYQRSICS